RGVLQSDRSQCCSPAVPPPAIPASTSRPPISGSPARTRPATSALSNATSRVESRGPALPAALTHLARRHPQPPLAPATPPNGVWLRCSRRSSCATRLPPPVPEPTTPH